MIGVLTSRSKVASNAFESVFSLSQKLIFEPGQYLTITLPNLKNDPKGKGRIFSIVNTPKENKILKILYRDTGSPYKKYLLNMKIGDTVKLSDPIGEFNPNSLNLSVSQSFVFLSAGIGIAPFLSMLPIKATWFVVNKSKSFAPYLDIIPKSAHFIFTNKKQRLDIPLIRSSLPNFSNHTYFLAGPPEFVEDLESQLIKAKISPQNIFRESFD